MVAAVAEFLVIDIGTLVLLSGLLLDSGDFLALFLRVLYLFLDDRDDFLVDCQVIVQVPGNEVVDEGPDGRALGYHCIALVIFLLFDPHVV